uniref:ARAD1B17578p n=1 Tax=Blastobotrys adeninivorans TaxID=409370 RepID=A0A060TBR3_BLAAD
MSYYPPQQPQPAYGYPPQQGYAQPPPQPIYIQQQPQRNDNDGCCCGLCAGLTCCLCLDCLF